MGVGKQGAMRRANAKEQGCGEREKEKSKARLNGKTEWQKRAQDQKKGKTS